MLNRKITKIGSAISRAVGQVVKAYINPTHVTPVGDAHRVIAARPAC